MFGGWPAESNPELLTVEFDLLSNDADSTTLNVTAIGSEVGMDFIGQSHNIALQSLDNPLEIDSTTGVVTLIDNPDYESQARYNFSIIATDSTGNSGDALDLSLNILNIDDTAPIFNHPSQPANGEPIEIIIDLNNTSNLDPGLPEAYIDDSFYSNQVHDIPENFYFLGYDSNFNNPYIYTDGNGNYRFFGELDSSVFYTNYNDGSTQTFFWIDATDSDKDIISESLSYSLENNDDAISIDANTGAISFTLNSFLFPESTLTANSTEAFTVVVTDSAGNSQQQAFTLRLNDQQAPVSELVCFFYAGVADYYTYISLLDVNHCMFDAYDASTISSISLTNNSDNYADSWSDDLASNSSISIGNTFVDFITFTVEDGIWNGEMNIITDWDYYDPDLDPMPEDIDLDFTITATDTSGNTSSKAYDIFIPYRVITPTVDIDCPSTINEMTASSHSDLGFDFGDSPIPSFPDNSQYVVCEIFAYIEFDGFYYDEVTYIYLEPSINLNGEMFLAHTLENPNYYNYENNREIESRPTEPKFLMVFDKNSLNFESNSEIDFSGSLMIHTDYIFHLQEPHTEEFTLSINNMDEVAPIIVSSSTATALEENTGENQVIYNANADDSLDISNGIVYSIKDLDNPNASAVNVPNLDDGTDQIYIAASSKIENQGERLAIKYASNDELGQSFNLYFDSSKLNFNDFNYQGEYFDYLRDYFYDLENNPNNIDQQTISKSDDLDDADNDPATDSFISFVLNNQNTFVLDFDFVASHSDQSTVNILSNSELVASHSISLPTEAGNNFSSPLSIDATNGEVSLSIDPDYETKAEYNFAIIATDMAGNISNEHIVSLTILDVLTENPPVISSATVVQSIAENSGSNQLIYTATAEFSPQGTQSLSFSLADGSDSALSINSTSGEVRLNTNPDYEQQSQYNFSVIASDGLGNSSDAQALSLSIENLDDTPPIISHELQPVTSDPIQITIDLNNLDALNPGFPTEYIYPNMDNYGSFDEVAYNNGSQQIFYVIDAADNTNDIVSGDLSYSLGEDTDSAISIDSVTGDISLVLNAPSETESNLQVGSTLAFTAIVTDAAENSSSHQIELNLTDTKAPNVSLECLYAMDDIWHSYDFQMGHPLDCSIGVYDSSSISSVVFAIANSLSFDEGLDESLDEGSSNEQSFITDSMDLMFFSRPETTGKWTGDIHYQSTVFEPLTSDTYQEFSIIASDAAGNETQAEYSIEIPYVDFSPTFNASCPAIDENSGSEQIVCELSWYILVDDEYYPAPLMMLLSDEGLELIEDDVFDNDITTAKVVLNTDPDYEMQSEYMMEFEFINLMGLPISSYLLTLSINNVDDTAPTFISSETALSIDENYPAGTIVYAATADDSNDVSEGVTFSLSGDDASAFSVDSETGYIQLNHTTDHETKPEYNFNVVATDFGGNSSQQALNLKVIDIDERGPVFTSGSSIQIDENYVDVIYTATAHDAGDLVSKGPIWQEFIHNADGTLTIKFFVDSSIYSELNEVEIAGFDFSYATDDDGMLTIDSIEFPSNPIIKMVNDSVDGQINFGLVLSESNPYAVDGALPLAEITFNMGDPATVATFSVSNVTLGTASDAVLLSSATVTEYVMDAPSTAAFILKDSPEFTIDADGNVSIIDANFEAASERSFTVVATDTNGNVTSQEVTVSINNLDELAPTITSGDTVFAHENSGSEQVVYMAIADDSADISAGVSFNLNGADANLFTIDTQSGEVTLLDNPDFETKSAYLLNVTASDGIFESTKSVTLYIYNLDEIAPTITSGGTATAIYENSGSGQIVYIGTAEDTGDFSDGFIFDLSQESDPELQINPYTGEVVLTVNPDYESQSEYNFNIVATDSAGNSGAQYVTLQIIQEEAIDPLFQSISVANEPQGIVGSTAKIEVMYEVSDENTQLPGIGFRVHFNSAVLSYIETNNIFTADLFVNAQGPFGDTEDFDNDATTDLYLSFGWASLFGNWPNTETPLNLFELSFDVSSDLDVHENSLTSINFTRTSNAEGYIFEPVNYEMNLLTASWDIDSNGTADALTDGLMLLRYAFGLRGDSLTNGAVATDSPLTNAEVEQNMIDTLIIADIDDNGEVDALTDGLLLLRYLFNLTGDSLTKGSVSAQGLRTTNTEITDYLDRHMP